jgi:hypothetical protein
LAGLRLAEYQVWRAESCGLTDSHAGVRRLMETVGKMSVR